MNYDHTFSFLVFGFLIGIVGFLFIDHSPVLHAESVDVSVTVVLFECNDGIDNDSDSFIDFPSDPGCTSSIDDSEIDPQCLDGIDNDADGLTDHPNDPGCDNPNDDDETDTVLPPPPGGSRGSSQRLNLPGAAMRVVLAGLAHPGSRVVLLKDAIAVGETRAGLDARFRITLSNVTPGNYVFTLHATDIKGIRSGLVSFTVAIPESLLVDINNIFIPPTIYLEDIRDGTSALVSGRTVPNAQVTITTFSQGREIDRFSTLADIGGRYAHIFSDSIFSVVAIPIKSFAIAEGITSPFSAAAAILSVSRNAILPGDFNFDRRIDLVDFSMLAFWYKRITAPEKFDLNNDGVVDLMDVSIMVSHWTG